MQILYVTTQKQAGLIMLVKTASEVKSVAPAEGAIT